MSLIKKKIATNEIEPIAEVEVKPLALESRGDLEEYKKISLSSIASLGVGFNAVQQAMNAISTAKGGSGLYWIDVPMGGRLARVHGEKNFIGAAIKDGKGLLGQSRIKRVNFDPTMLCMAIVLNSIEKKMEDIRETQEKILAFLEMKERTKMEANVEALFDALENYKHNWDNKLYKEGNYQQIKNIRREAEQSIKLYRSKISKEIAKKSFFQTDKNVEEKMKETGTDYGNYQLALYVYAFAYFLEVTFLGNFEKEYLQSVVKNVRKHCSEYSDLYDEVYGFIEKSAKTTIETQTVKALAGVSKGAGNLFSKIPVVNKTKIDEKLISVGESFSRKSEEKTENKKSAFFDGKTDFAEPFLENIQMLDRLNNDRLRVLIDGENLYLEN